MKSTESNSSKERARRFRIPGISGRMAVRAYFTDSSQKLLVDQDTVKKGYGKETSTATLLAHPLAQEIMRNDGRSTYLMHSTSVERAERVMMDGLRLERNRDNPATPNLGHTTKMMPGAGEPGARKRIEHGITYRYGAGGNNAKLVIRFDEPNPGTSLRADQFLGTAISTVDGTNILPTGDVSHPYTISPDRILGYFDLDTGVFAPNPLLGQDRP